MLKVIVAEDNCVQLAYLTGLIENLGFDVMPVENGLLALELVQNSDAEILISDFRMPGLNGIELTQRVRELELEHYVHVIMLTGTDEDDIRTEALAAGVDDFFTKGSNQGMLKARIRTASRLIQHAKDLAERNRKLKESSERIQADLEAAAAAQRSMLPEFHTQMLGFRVASAFAPSSFVSGDMYGCFPLNDLKLGFYTVDVAGHGVHASLLSVAIGHLITPAFFRNKVLSHDGPDNPAALITDLNERFTASIGDEYFTMFCGVVDRNSGEMTYCQAGYPSPFYLGKSGDVQTVGDGGFPVGMFHEAEFENNIWTFEPGGHLIICSDAASEAENSSNTPFGLIRLQDILARTTEPNATSTPDNIVSALTTWRQGEPLEDDLTIVALERTIP